MKLFVWGTFGSYPECSGGTIVIANDLDEARKMLKQERIRLFRNGWARMGWTSLEEAVRETWHYDGEPDLVFEVPIVLALGGNIYIDESY